MGEIAEMMLEGLLDCETGEFIDGLAPGYPRTLESAARDPYAYAYAHEGMTRQRTHRRNRKPRDTQCQQCGKWVRGKAGLRMHTKDAHKTAE